MRLNSYVKTLTIVLVGLLSAIPSAQALFPTLDVSAIGQCAQSITQQIDQYKSMILQSKTVGSINSAIGDAKASMSKFNLDAAKQQIKKAEKAKKALEKVKKIKEDIEKAKAEFEAKKAQYEEYKKQIEKAKKDIKDTADSVKGAYDDAKNTVSTVTSAANQAIDDAKNKVSSVEESINQKIENVSDKVSDVSNQTPQKPSNSVNVPATEPSSPTINPGRVSFSTPNTLKQSVPGAVVDVPSVSEAPLPSVGGRNIINGAGAGDVPVIGNTSMPMAERGSVGGANVDNSETLSPAQITSLKGSSAGVNALSRSVSEAIAAQDISALQEISEMDEAEIINSDSKVYETPEEENSEENEGPSATLVKQKAKSKAAQAKNNVSTRATQVNNIPSAKSVINSVSSSASRATPVNTTQGRVPFGNSGTTAASAEVNAQNFGSTLSQSINTIQTIEDASDIPSIQAPLSQQELFKADNLLSPISEMGEEQNIEELSAIRAKTEAEKIKTTTEEDEDKVGDEQPLSSITPAKETVKNLPETKAVNNTIKSITNAVSATTVPANKTSVPQTKNNAASPETSGRKAFRPADKSSFWLEDEENIRENKTKLSNIQTLKFADKVSECTYNNAIQNQDDGEITILPETMAKECCIEAKNLTDMRVIKDCADKVLKKLTNSDDEIRKEGTGLYSLIIAEQNIYSLAESLADTKDSSAYFSNVLVPYMKDIKKTESNTTTTNDKITSIAMTNAQMLYLLNRIRRIHTSALSTTAFSKLRDIQKSALDEETDIGLGEIKGEYASTIVRGVNKNSQTETSEVSLEYPVIPENLAKKCLLKLDAEGLAKVKECYLQVIQEANVKNYEETQVGLNFVESIKYQDVLNILATSLYQKVASAQYDEELEVIKENITNGTTERTNGDGLFKTNYEIQKALDDIVNIYAARIAYSSLSKILQITPQATATEKEG